MTILYVKESGEREATVMMKEISSYYRSGEVRVYGGTGMRYTEIKQAGFRRSLVNRVMSLMWTPRPSAERIKDNCRKSDTVRQFAS